MNRCVVMNRRCLRHTQDCDRFKMSSPRASVERVGNVCAFGLVARRHFESVAVCASGAVPTRTAHDQICRPARRDGRRRQIWSGAILRVAERPAVKISMLKKEGLA